VEPSEYDELGEGLNRIGVALSDVVGDPDARILLYAEVTEVLYHAIMRYALPGAEELRCGDEGDEVADLVRDVWERSRAAGLLYRWRAMVYLVKDRKMNVKLLYDEQVDPELSMWEKEDLLLQEHFPGMNVGPAEELPGGVELSLADPRPFWRKFWR